MNLNKKIMSYYFTKKITNTEFDLTIEKVTEILQKHGFGVLTEIDVKSTLKQKLDVDFKRYKILGACNPPNAYKALQDEDNIGLMLPCNVVVYENDDNSIQVSAVDPVASMQAVENNKLVTVATDIRDRLKSVIDDL